MILAADEQNNNLEQQQNRKNSGINLEELFQQLLVLEKTPNLNSSSPSRTHQTLQPPPSILTTTPTTMDDYAPRSTLHLQQRAIELHSGGDMRNLQNCTRFPIDKTKDIFIGKRIINANRIFYPLQTIPIRYIVISAIVVLLINIKLTLQNLCPKPSCECDSIEMICRQPYGAYSMPHTLSQETIRVTINNAQASQFQGLDYLVKLEDLDYAYNRISIIDFKEITKLTNLINLNTSHNNITDIHDSLVNTALSDIGLTTFSALHDQNGNNNNNNDEQLDLRPLKKLQKINVINFVCSHNYLVALRNYTFIRWSKLQKLDLSYNSLETLDSHSLFGLNKLESLNLRGNLLIQVPTLALQSTSLSLSSVKYLPMTDQTRPSSLKYLDLSENSLRNIGANSFSTLEKALELYLESCSLESLHEQSFNGLHTLGLLSLDNNHLKSVPSKAFEYIRFLRSLRMNSNRLVDIQPDSFSYLNQLEDLQINYGFFKELRQGVFNGIDSLRRLEITNNSHLTTIEAGAMENLERLTYLNLTSNGLTSLPLEEKPRNALQILDLRMNPLSCGCELKWLTKWLKKFNETINIQTPTTRLTPFHTTIINSKLHIQINEAQNLQLMDPNFMAKLMGLSCSGPAALKGKLIMELPDNKLECLKPDSMLHVNIGFAALFFISFIMTFMCTISFCKNRKHLFIMLKEGLFQNDISIVLPYSQNLHKNVDDLKNETRLYGDIYEQIDYGCPNQLFTLTGTGNGNHDQVMFCGQESSLNTNRS